MEIDSTHMVDGKIRGTISPQKTNPDKPDNEETPENKGTPTEEAPDYRISLSEASRKAVAELAGSPSPDQAEEQADLSEEQAARLAQQVSSQLSQDSASISNTAIQRAVDLFT